MAAIGINRNGDPAELDEDEPTKILVVGDQRCGKSTFIRTFADNNFAGPIVEDHGATVYTYDHTFNGVTKQFKFAKISGLYNVKDILMYHGDAIGCFFMYAVDDPLSFIHVKEWLDEVDVFLNWPMNPKIIVGFKNDLRNDPQVIQRLQLENRTPITEQQGRDFSDVEEMDFFDCSMHNLEIIKEAFDTMLGGFFF